MANPSRRPSSKKHRPHARIVAPASRIARTEGLAAASVSRVMHGAGLTTGGFSAHFRSKHAMDAEVVAATLDDHAIPWAVERYLTARHRDNPRRGCAFPTLVSEVARADAATRLALCIGGLALSRAMRGTTTSNEMLVACRKWAATRPGAPSRKPVPPPR